MRLLGPLKSLASAGFAGSGVLWGKGEGAVADLEEDAVEVLVAVDVPVAYTAACVGHGSLQMLPCHDHFTLLLDALSDCKLARLQRGQ